MKNRNQAMASLWSVAIVLSVAASIFAVLFAAFTGWDRDSAPSDAPQATEAIVTAEPADETEVPAEETETAQN